MNAVGNVVGSFLLSVQTPMVSLKCITMFMSELDWALGNVIFQCTVSISGEHFGWPRSTLRLVGSQPGFRDTSQIFIDLLSIDHADKAA